MFLLFSTITSSSSIPHPSVFSAPPLGDANPEEEDEEVHHHHQEQQDHFLLNISDIFEALSCFLLLKVVFLTHLSIRQNLEENRRHHFHHSYFPTIVEGGWGGVRTRALSDKNRPGRFIYFLLSVPDDELTGPAEGGLVPGWGRNGSPPAAGGRGGAGGSGSRAREGSATSLAASWGNGTASPGAHQGCSAPWSQVIPPGPRAPDAAQRGTTTRQHQ